MGISCFPTELVKGAMGGWSRLSWGGGGGGRGGGWVGQPVRNGGVMLVSGDT